MSIYPCVRWQGKSINEQNTVYESSYTDFGVPKKEVKQDETLAIDDQTQELEVEIDYNKNSQQVEVDQTEQVVVENENKSQTKVENKTTKIEQVNIVEEQIL